MKACRATLIAAAVCAIGTAQVDRDYKEDASQLPPYQPGAPAPTPAIRARATAHGRMDEQYQLGESHKLGGAQAVVQANWPRAAKPASNAYKHTAWHDQMRGAGREELPDHFRMLRHSGGKSVCSVREIKEHCMRNTRGASTMSMSQKCDDALVRYDEEEEDEYEDDDHQERKGASFDNVSATWAMLHVALMNICSFFACALLRMSAL